MNDAKKGEGKTEPTPAVKSEAKEAGAPDASDHVGDVSRSHFRLPPPRVPPSTSPLASLSFQGDPPQAVNNTTGESTA